MTSRETLQRWSLLFAIFATGFCGMIAEYSVATLVSYFIGNGLVAYTVIISSFLAAFGLGSILSERVGDHEIKQFLMVEMLLSMLTAVSAVAIAFAARWQLTWVVALGLTIGIGALVGFEIPLITRINEKRGLLLKENISKVLFLDYVGSAVAGLCYATLILPNLGTALTPVLGAGVNLCIALVMLVAFHSQLKTTRLLPAAALSVGFLSVLWIKGDGLVFDQEQTLYRDTVVYSEQTPYQKIVLTDQQTGGFGLCLFLNGGTQMCERDEHRYHEMLVHPAFAVKPTARRVLVLGGGDGLAVREILKYPNTDITLVDLDPAVVSLARSHPRLRALNEGSFDDPRVQTIAADAYIWLEHSEEWWDIIYVDLPDPSRIELGKLYSREFYSIVRSHLAPDGVMVTQSTSPIHAREAFVTIWATIGAAGFRVLPYRMNVPSFGDWGWNLAVRDVYLSPEELKDRLENLQLSVETRVLNRAAMQAAMRWEKGVFPEDPSEITVSRLANQQVVQAYNRGAWKLLP